MAITTLARSISLPRIDRRTLLGVALAATAALLVLLLTKPAPTVPILVARSDLPARTMLGDLDVTVRNVTSASGLVQGDSIGEFESWTLVAPLAAGEPLLASLLTPPELLERSDLLALQVPEAHAVLGRLAPGDLVDVYVTTSGALGEPSKTELVAAGVFVVDSRAAPGAISEPRVEVLLAVDGDLAPILAAAARTGDVDLVKRGA